MQELNDFLEADGLLIDVRSPSEFHQAHIPGAVSFPLFSDAERAQVGTIFKSQGQKEAIHLGLSIVGPKLHDFASQIDLLLKGKRAKVYCFRGGLRSQSMSWLFRLNGIEVLSLKRGYKGFRSQSAHLETLLAEKKFNFCVLTGLTGSGKTEKLHQLQFMGEHIIDLESLANHRGSAFGKLGPQPTQEMFENCLFDALRRIPPHSIIYIEDESRMIGHRVIPQPLFAAMQKSPKIPIHCSIEERAHRILASYSHLDLPTLLAAVNAIKKRLGSQRAHEISFQLKEGQYKEALLSLLSYYDKSYLPRAATLEVEGDSPILVLPDPL